IPGAVAPEPAVPKPLAYGAEADTGDGGRLFYREILGGWGSGSHVRADHRFQLLAHHGPETVEHGPARILERHGVGSSGPRSSSQHAPPEPARSRQPHT